jgi:hypothetical protein
MKNTTDILNLVEHAVNGLISTGKATYPGSNGYPHALGFAQATLSHVLIELNEINPKAAERFIRRLENLNSEI